MNTTIEEKNKDHVVCQLRLVYIAVTGPDFTKTRILLRHSKTTSD
jgi:hypothetical protein